MVEPVAFSTLRDTLRAERENLQLQLLPKELECNISAYFSTKLKTISENKKGGDSFSNKLLDQHQRELSNARDTVVELFHKRAKKISLMALEAVATDSVVDLSNLTTAEKTMFEEVYSLIKAKKDDFLARLFAEKGHTESVKNNGGELKIRIIEELPVFIGADAGQYGPYAPGQEVSLPEKNARLLIDKGKAALVA